MDYVTIGKLKLLSNDKDQTRDDELKTLLTKDRRADHQADLLLQIVIVELLALNLL